MNKVKEPAAFYGPIQKYESNLTDPYQIVVFANKGLPASSFDDLIRISSGNREVFANRLNISIKTLDRYKKEGKKLDPQMSELILKWIELYSKGMEVFGSIPSFNRWLEKPAFGLFGTCPNDLMSTSGGIELILAELRRIEHGDLA
jgi:putative toxin-antitoxin system antitoxin component (TIGR02293 family)